MINQMQFTIGEVTYAFGGTPGGAVMLTITTEPQYGDVQRRYEHIELAYEALAALRLFLEQLNTGP